MKAVPGILPTLLEMIYFFSTPTIDVEPKKLRITKENHRNQAIPVIFGGDYWTRTSGLMRVKIR